MFGRCPKKVQFFWSSLVFPRVECHAILAVACPRAIIRGRLCSWLKFNCISGVGEGMRLWRRMEWWIHYIMAEGAARNEWQSGGKRGRFRLCQSGNYIIGQPRTAQNPLLPLRTFRHHELRLGVGTPFPGIKVDVLLDQLDTHFLTSVDSSWLKKTRDFLSHLVISELENLTWVKTLSELTDARSQPYHPECLIAYWCCLLLIFFIIIAYLFDWVSNRERGGLLLVSKCNMYRLGDLQACLSSWVTYGSVHLAASPRISGQLRISNL